MDDRLKQIQKLLDAAEGNLHSARNLLRDLTGTSSGNAAVINPEERAKDLNVIEEGKIIEGVYDGENMIGPDGKDYPVPANYASKSKLVEGDVLKLTIADDGSFIYKQIRPIERRKTIGTLTYSGGIYAVNADGKTYKVLQASVTYYKGEPGDQVSLILPKDHESSWGAIENIVKKVGEDGAPIVSEQTPAEDEATVSEAGTSGPTIEEALEQTEDKTSKPETNETESTEETGPEIEFPRADATSGTTVEAEQAPNIEVTEPKKDDNDNGSQGIKELEI